jgi:hypothetical protein
MDRLESKHPLAIAARRAFPGYRGRKFRVVISDRPRSLLSYWEGGSRDEFMILQDGRVFPPPTVSPYARKDVPEFVPVSGAILVEHSIFMGKDAGCTIYLHPEDASLI